MMLPPKRAQLMWRIDDVIVVCPKGLTADEYKINIEFLELILSQWRRWMAAGSRK